MIADILNYKGLRGWSCGDSYATLTWDDAEAGRAKPSEEEIAAWDLEYEADKVAQSQTQQADVTARQAAKVEPVIQYLVTHTPEECAQYVQDNVVDLASARAFLKKVAMALSVLARKDLR